MLQLETERTANPVIQRVKLIMSAGLMLVHMLSRWPISNTSNSQLPSDTDPTLDQSMLLNLSKNSRALNVQSETAIASAGVTSVATETSLFEFYLRRWLSVSPEQLVMLGLVTALTIKYIFFDSKENLEQEIRSATNDKNKLQQEVISNTELDEANSKERKDGSSSRSGGDQPRIIVTSQDSDGERLLSDTQPSTTVKQRRQSSRKSSTSTNASNSTAVATAGTADGQSSVQASFFLGEDSASDFSEDIELVEKEVQTEDSCMEEVLKEMRGPNQPVRELDQLVALLASDDGVRQLTDEELLLLVSRKKIPSYKLESVLGDAERGVKIRRFLLATQVPANGESIVKIPYTRYDYSLVLGACCENVIGYMPIPLGVAGPLLMDGEKYQVPMATTEGCLVASTNRGCRALTLSGGIRSSITGDGMTRGPVVRFPCAARAAEVNNWLKEAPNHALIKEAFDSTSRFARLENILSHIAGRNLYLRFAAKTGDAMGMNMVSKGTELALNRLQELFTDMEIISLSGNFCSDKKPSAVNWIEGRGKSVVCEAQVPAKVVSEILKTTVAELVQLNISKNLIGSAVAGSIGGNNAHAANIVAAIYIATGQVIIFTNFWLYKLF